MKKILALTLAATVLSAGAAMANPVELDGSLKFEYRNNTSDSYDGHHTGARYTFRLNALNKVDDHFDLYARLGAQAVTHVNEIGADYYGNESADAAIEHFGFIYKNADVQYKIGRQSVTLGETALLYNNDAFVGQKKFADGVTATTKTGVTDLKAVAVQEDNLGINNDNKLFAVQASYKPAKDWKVGATVASYNRESGLDTNHWAVNAGYTFGKAGIVGEFAKSDADDKDTARVIGMTYDFDSKNSAYIYNHRTEKNGDIGGMTDFDNGEKGMYYGFAHKISKDTTASLFYKDNKNIDTGLKNDSFRVALTYTF